MIGDIEFSLRWGVMCDPISKQLKEQGIDFIEKDTLKYFDKLKDACNTLCFVVPDSVSNKNYEKANQKVVKTVEAQAKEMIKKGKKAEICQEVQN